MTAGSLFAHYFVPGLAVVDIGPAARTRAHLVEQRFMIPEAFVASVGIRSSLRQNLLMNMAWEALDPMRRHAVDAAYAAQALVALGGNPRRASAHPWDHLRLALTAVEIFRSAGLRGHLGRGYLQLGRALLDLGRPSDAVTALVRGCDLLAAAADGHALMACRCRLAILMTSLGFPEQGLTHAANGLAIGAELEKREPDCRTAVGHVYELNNLNYQLVRALTEIGFLGDAQAAWERWREAGSGDYVFDMAFAAGEILQRRGSHAQALDFYVRATDARFGKPGFPSQAERGYLVSRSAEFVGTAVGAALGQKRPDLALAILGAIGTDRPPRRAAAAGDPQPLAGDVAALAREATRAAVARDHGLLTALDTRTRDLLETRDELAAGEADPAPVRSVADLAVAIPCAVRRGELALVFGEYSTGQMILLAVHGGVVEERTLRITADEVTELALAARTECRERDGTAALDRLGAALLEPVTDLVGEASRIYVYSQGLLGEFPFHAAPFRGRPLVATAEVRALPSLVPLRSERPEGAPPGAALTAVVAAVREPRYELLPELSALAAEADAVRAAFPAITVLLDDAATAGAVRQSIGLAGVLHLAGHAHFDPGRPNMARILLADRPLFAFEVAFTDRAPRLVNLSGCRAGGQWLNHGGEGEGLAPAFLTAGSETVVAPTWPVLDDACLAFNEVLYRELASPGADVNRSVRRAQLALQARPEFAHPGVWGAFTVLGRI